MIDISQSLQVKIDNSEDELKTFIQKVISLNEKNEKRLEKILKQSDSQQLQLLKLNEKVKTISETDKLTSLFNRQKAEKALADLIDKKTSFSVMLIGIDDFRIINQKFDIPTVDSVLKITAQIVKQFSKKDSFVGRWSADNFIFTDPNLTLDEMLDLAEEICDKAESSFFPNVGQVTVSIGVSSSKTQSTRESVVHNMNNTLNKAKDNGKNQVSV